MALLLPTTLPHFRQVGQQLAPGLEVDGAAVVGIHQAEVPELITLIDVRGPGCREMHQGACQGIPESGSGDALDEAVEIGQEARALLGGEQCPHEVTERCLESGIGIDPAGVLLRLARGFLHVGLDALAETLRDRQP